MKKLFAVLFIFVVLTSNVIFAQDLDTIKTILNSGLAKLETQINGFESRLELLKPRVTHQYLKEQKIALEELGSLRIKIKQDLDNFKRLSKKLNSFNVEIVQALFNQVLTFEQLVSRTEELSVLLEIEVMKGEAFLRWSNGNNKLFIVDAHIEEKILSDGYFFKVKFNEVTKLGIKLIKLTCKGDMTFEVSEPVFNAFLSNDIPITMLIEWNGGEPKFVSLFEEPVFVETENRMTPAFQAFYEAGKPSIFYFPELEHISVFNKDTMEADIEKVSYVQVQSGLGIFTGLERHYISAIKSAEKK